MHTHSGQSVHLVHSRSHYDRIESHLIRYSLCLHADLWHDQCHNGKYDKDLSLLTTRQSVGLHVIVDNVRIQFVDLEFMMSVFTDRIEFIDELFIEEVQDILRIAWFGYIIGNRIFFVRIYHQREIKL